MVCKYVYMHALTALYKYFQFNSTTTYVCMNVVYLLLLFEMHFEAITKKKTIQTKTNNQQTHIFYCNISFTLV